MSFTSDNAQTLLAFERPKQESAVPATEAAICYVRVLVHVTAKSIQDRLFTYRVPPELVSEIQIGQPVMVPFGAQPELMGFVTDVMSVLPADDRARTIRDISDIADDMPLFDRPYYNFIAWVADYYATTPVQVLACALPGALFKKMGKRVLPGSAMQDATIWAGVLDELFKRSVSQGSRSNQSTARVNRQTQADVAAARSIARSLLTASKGKFDGYRPRYLAVNTGMPLRSLNRLLHWLKSRDAVVLESDWVAGTAPKTVKTVFLPEPESIGKPAKPLTPRQQVIVDAVSARTEGIPLSELLDSVGTNAPTVKKLVEAGWLRIDDVTVQRDSLGLLRQRAAFAPGDGFILSASQHRVLDAVIDEADRLAKARVAYTERKASYEEAEPPKTEPFLLYGVTGSGKTEVYLSMARAMMERGLSTLVMAPEIALTSQIARRFIRYFGADNVALWHSNLSDGERADTWRRLQNGDIPILIGARSAIWAPMPNLGLILIDEAHEGSFKQDSPDPRYDARVLAEELSNRRGIPLVLGSATPDLGAFYRAVKENRVLHLTERFGNKALATVEVADMGQEKREGNKSPLSRLLREAIQTNLDEGGQTIILLNRRGFFTTIQCVTCEYIFQCPHCDVSLTFHRGKNRVCCHYCGFEDERPVFCAACASSELNHTGLGTQRLEDEVLKHFPDARVLRLDGDIMQRKNAHLDVFEAFSAGEADILIGTQIVAKGLDVANVTLVGVVNADSTFALPDFKSAERGFQLLTQVAGRAGRGSKAGRVVIQAVQAHHPVLQFAADQDYPAFYDDEIAQRETLGFPPFSQLFRFIASGENEEKTQQYIMAATLHLKEALQAAGLGDAVRLMGPAPCALPRIRDRYRFHLLAKNFAGEAGHRLLTDFYRRAINSALPDDLNWILDIDTQTLL